MQFPFNGNGRFHTIPKRLCTVFLPLTCNDGSAQPDVRLQRAEERLVQLAGGMTWYNPGDGLWVPSPQADVIRDRIAPVHVVTDNGPQADAQMTNLVAEITEDFEQDRLFVFAQEVWVMEPVLVEAIGSALQPMRTPV